MKVLIFLFNLKFKIMSVPWYWFLLTTLSFQIIDRDSALQRYCKRCVRWHPAAATSSPSQNVAAMGDEAGVTSVSFAHFLELPSTKRYVLMARDTPLMEEVKSWGNSCILSNSELHSLWLVWRESGKIIKII